MALEHTRAPPRRPRDPRPHHRRRRRRGRRRLRPLVSENIRGVADWVEQMYINFLGLDMLARSPRSLV